MNQEQVTYRVEYNGIGRLRTQDEPSNPTEGRDGEKELSFYVHGTWREQICLWSYRVVDHFDIPREIVEISLNLFDRFMASRGNRCNSNLALLASLTTLHLAIKIHSADKRIKISTMANLSRGQFSARHIETMEWQILKAVGWKLHPPTVFAFISYFLRLLPSSEEADGLVRKDLFELSVYMAELSVCDSFFIHSTASTVAFAAVLNAMERMPYSRLSQAVREAFLQDLAQNLDLHCRAPHIMVACNRLMLMLTDVSKEVPSMEAGGTYEGHSSSWLGLENTAPAPSVRSSGSSSSRQRHGGMLFGSRPRLGSSDSSKGSCRYSPSPHRRQVVAPSPHGLSRARASSLVTGTQ